MMTLTLTERRAVHAMATLMVGLFISGTLLRTFLPGEPIIPTPFSCSDIPFSVYGFDKQVLYSLLE